MHFQLIISPRPFTALRAPPSPPCRSRVAVPRPAAAHLLPPSLSPPHPTATPSSGRHGRRQPAGGHACVRRRRGRAARAAAAGALAGRGNDLHPRPAPARAEGARREGALLPPEAQAFQTKTKASQKQALLAAAGALALHALRMCRVGRSVSAEGAVGGRTTPGDAPPGARPCTLPALGRGRRAQARAGGACVPATLAMGPRGTGSCVY